MLEVIKREFDKNRYFYILLFINIIILSMMFNNMSFALNVLVDVTMIMMCRYGELNKKRVGFISAFNLTTSIILMAISIKEGEAYKLIYEKS